MAESSTKAGKAETETKSTAKTKEGGEITYEDKGDYTLVTDNRLGDGRVERIPKTLRDVPVDEATQKEVEERLEAEATAKQEKADAELQADEAPPVKDSDASEKIDLTVTAKGKEDS